MGAGEAGFVLCELEWVRVRLLLLLSCGELAEFSVAAADGVAEVGPGLVRRLREVTDDIETLLMSVVQRVSGRWRGFCVTRNAHDFLGIPVALARRCGSWPKLACEVASASGAVRDSASRACVGVGGSGRDGAPGRVGGRDRFGRCSQSMAAWCVWPWWCRGWSGCLSSPTSLSEKSEVKVLTGTSGAAANVVASCFPPGIVMRPIRSKAT
jgi:hypothetical protein